MAAWAGLMKWRGVIEPEMAVTSESDWIPIKWPSGPLEVSSRARARTLTPEIKDMVQAWHSPATLESARGTPVNCLIVNWATGQPEDIAQQTSLAPLINASREMGLSVVGKVSVKGKKEPAITAGLQAGLAAVLVEEPPARPSALPVIMQSPRSKVPWVSTFALLSITENRWPGVGMTTMQGDAAIAGPTGIPWVDSNGWFSLLAHQLGKGKTIWLDIDPPNSPHSRSSPIYCLTVADSQVYGSRWVISLDDQLRLGVIKKKPEAVSLWDRIVTALAFFKTHQEWSGFQPSGVIGVISDFRGENESFAEEVLNLLSRRHVQYKIIERSHSSSAPLEHLEAVAWLDAEAPSDELRSKLLAFARQGGLLVASPSWSMIEGDIIGGDFSDNYELRRVGKGRTAVARHDFQDPYQVTVDIHLMLSRRDDLVRLYNTGTANCFCSVDPKSRIGLVQILNYSSSGPANFVTLWVKTQNRSARLWAFDAKRAALVRGSPSAGGVEFDLPSISVYSAIEIENWMQP